MIPDDLKKPKKKAGSKGYLYRRVENDKHALMQKENLKRRK